MMTPSNIDRLQVSLNQGMRRILGVPRRTSAKMMRHKHQMLPVEQRAKLNRVKLYRKIRGNTKHPLHATIHRRQRNGWTTEIQECRRLVSRLTQRPNINWKPAHTGIPGNENADQVAKKCLELDRIHTTVNTSSQALSENKQGCKN